MKRNLLLIAALLLSAQTFAKEGMYLEFKMTSPSMNGSSKTYSSDGNTRSETSINIEATGGSFATATLILKDNPTIVYMLNERDKTYSEQDVNKSGDKQDDDYTITVIGKEKVNNYNSTHVKVHYNKTGHETEMWLSKDVLNYSYYASVKNKYLGGATFFKALKEKGADGFVVRMLVVGERGGQIQMDLVAAEKKNLDASLFSLDGYTKSAGRPMSPAGAGMSQEQMQKVKDMTPEERQKYIQDMKAKYQQQQPQH